MHPDLNHAIDIMRTYPHRWAVCGGRAIDLHLGRVTRDHKDIDFAILRRDQLAAQAFMTGRGWSLEVAHQGEMRRWEPGDYLQLPLHTIWCSHHSNVPNFVELLLNEADDADFIFRRDRSIRLPLEHAFLQTPGGIPYLAPEIVLLYKANNIDHPGNAADFETMRHALDNSRREWFNAALARLYGDGHGWTVG